MTSATKIKYSHERFGPKQTSNEVTTVVTTNNWASYGYVITFGNEDLDIEEAVRSGPIQLTMEGTTRYREIMNSPATPLPAPPLPLEETE